MDNINVYCSFRQELHLGKKHKTCRQHTTANMKQKEKGNY